MTNRLLPKKATPRTAYDADQPHRSFRNTAATGVSTSAVEEARSLGRNSTWIFVAYVVYAASQWATLSLLAKLGTTSMVGQYVLALALIRPSMAFFMLQLRSVLATDAQGEYRFGDYLAVRLVMTLLALVAIAGLCLTCGYRLETSLVILAAAASAAIDALSDIVYGAFQQHERMDRIAQAMMLKSLATVAGFAILLAATGELLWGLLGMLVIQGVILATWELPRAAQVLASATGAIELPQARDHCRPRWDKSTMAGLAKSSLPLGVVMMLITLLSSLPRFFVEHYRGEAELGIFGAIAYFSVVGSTAVNALGQSAAPRLARYYAHQESRAFARLLIQLSLVGAALGLAAVGVAWIAGRPLLTLLYGAQYGAHSDLLVWLMLVTVISYPASFGGYAITAARYFRVQMPLFAAVAAVTAIASWWLVPSLGLRGAALALLLAACVQACGIAVLLFYALHSLQPSHVRT